jgi:transposase
MDTQERWSIIFAWQKCHNISQVASQLGRSRPTVRHWVNHYLEHGNVDSANKCGRPPALDYEAAEEAVQLLLSDDTGTASQAARVLHAEGKSSKLLHNSTIIRHAKRAAAAPGKPLQVVRGLPAKQLSQDTIKKRVAFATKNKWRRWDNVMFTDRKKFNFYYPGVPVKPQKWVIKGERWRAPRVNHAQVLNVYAGIGKKGIARAHIVAGTSKHISKFLNKAGQVSKNITAAEYEAVVRDTFLPAGGRLFGSRSWVLQQDNDPSHKKAALKALAAYNKKNNSNIQLLPNWPPNSPDLSPIENVWGYVQAKVNARGCKTFHEFKQAVLSELKAVPKDMLKNLLNSMPNRLADCLQEKGGMTKY